MCAIAAVRAFCGRHCGASDITDEERLILETVQWSEKGSGWDPSLDFAAKGDL